MDSRAELTDLYRRYIARCNEHRFAELDEFVADHINGPGEGLAGYIAGLEDIVRAFPDYQWEPVQILVDGDHLAVRLWGTGTHRGEFRGVAPTGRAIRTQELVIYRVRDGRLVNCWGDLGSVVRDELVSG